MRFLSVCSGIEAASVAWEPLGWQALAFSEIEAFPRALLAQHYPDVPLHGDFTKLRDEAWIADADVLVGGTPCQAFSVAGLRKSLSDDRGNLSLEFIRLADAIDDLRRDAGRPPAWIVWENVPGVLSTSDNAFGAFLGGLVGGDEPIVPRGRGWTRAGVVAGPGRVAAWRILDAQYFGLAQRRQRVFVLALGGAGGWRCADALLPVADSLSGHPAPRREAGEGTAGTLAARAGRGFNGQEAYSDHLIANTLRGRPNASHRADSDNYIAHAFDHTGPLDTDGYSTAIAFAVRGREDGAQPEVHEAGDSISALRAASGGSSRDYVAGSAVRRLMPTECEALQGFPRGYTAITYRGKPAADGPRYKALGNSMAVPVMAWIGRRIAAVEAIQIQREAA